MNYATTQTEGLKSVSNRSCDSEVGQLKYSHVKANGNNRKKSRDATLLDCCTLDKLNWRLCAVPAEVSE